ncbi:hypothetical protein [Oricola indica]|uniref:hypothetical protein n=1 Tax=Oricola indica TaxID=2872591 RepID=UPI00308432CE
MIFPAGVYRQDRDGNDITYEELRWSRLKNADPQRIFLLVSEFVFPFLREMAEEGTAHSEHMKGARFTIPTPGLTEKGVMDPSLLYESPFIDVAPEGPQQVFAMEKARRLVEVIEGLNESAVG